MFKFIVIYFGFLKHIPFLAGLFDALMMIWNMTFNSKLMDSIEHIENEIAKWDGISRSVHKFGGIQFNYRSKEIGHIHSNGILDILFTKKIKSELIQHHEVFDHHIFPHSGWISFYIRSASDIPKAMWLLELSYTRGKKF